MGFLLEARLTGVQAELLTQMFDKIGPDAEDAWRTAMRVLAESQT